MTDLHPSQTAVSLYYTASGPQGEGAIMGSATLATMVPSSVAATTTGGGSATTGGASGATSAGGLKCGQCTSREQDIVEWCSGYQWRRQTARSGCWRCSCGCVVTGWWII